MGWHGVTSDQQRVLVTGGAGFIGSHVAERFEREGFAVRVLDNLATGQRGNIAESWEWIEADVRDSVAVADAVKGVHFVAHLAAFVSLPESFERHEDCYATNVQGTYNLLEACRANAVQKLVFASSSAVYSEEPAAPKAESECPTRSALMRPRNSRASTCWPLSRPTTACLRSRFASSTCMARVSRPTPPMRPPCRYSSNAGSACRPPPSTATAVRHAISYSSKTSPMRCSVRVGSEHTACITWGRELRRRFSISQHNREGDGFNEGPRFEERRQGDLRASTADIARIRRDLGWSPEFSLEQGLRETLAWYRAKVDRDC